MRHNGGLGRGALLTLQPENGLALLSVINLFQVPEVGNNSPLRLTNTGLIRVAQKIQVENARFSLRKKKKERFKMFIFYLSGKCIRQ